MSGLLIRSLLDQGREQCSLKSHVPVTDNGPSFVAQRFVDRPNALGRSIPPLAGIRSAQPTVLGFMLFGRALRGDPVRMSAQSSSRYGERVCAERPVTARQGGRRPN